MKDTMIKWQYFQWRPKLIRNDKLSLDEYIVKSMNEFGLEGWELIHIDGLTYTFKRQI